MSGRSVVWFLAAGLCFMTAMTAQMAFRQMNDRSPLAVVQWSIIAIAIVAPLFLIPGLLAPGPHEASIARNRCSRVLILVYLPLSSALYLLAFSAR
jgi:hypothetical protein